MKKVYNILLITGFLLVLFFFPVATKLLPHRDISTYENRTLEPVPVFSKESFLDGTYLPKWETYFSDHFAFRDEIIYGYTYINANIFKKVNVNDIIITKNALLPYNPVRTVDEEKIKSDCEKMGEKLSRLNDECKKAGAEFIYVGIPEQRSMLREDYPKFLENDNEYLTCVEREFFNTLNKRDIEYINMMEIFKNEDYHSYYSVTDHHYNIFGTLRTYNAIMEKLEEKNLANGRLHENNFELTTLKNDFFGSRARMIYKAYPMPDYLAYFSPVEEIPFERYDRTTKVSRIFFTPADETTDITYNVYMGGDNAETLIHTNRPSLPKVLIFGDSFTNPLETLLYTSFDSMLAIDLRHNKKSIYEYIEEFKPDVVLLVRDDTCYTSNDGNGNF